VSARAAARDQPLASDAIAKAVRSARIAALKRWREAR
jgi:hypothetical protein